MKTLSGAADLEVRGPRGGFDETVYARSRAMPDVAVASPVVEVDARIAGRDEALRIYGVDAFRAAAVTPALVGAPRCPRRVAPGRSVPPARGRAVARHQAGDTLACRRDAGIARSRRRARATRDRGERYAVMDIAAAQDAFARRGACRASTCACGRAPTSDAVRAPIAALLPAGVTAARRRRHGGDDLAHVARLPREPQRAGAGRAVHRRLARVLDAGAVGRPPARAVRAAAHARPDARRARALAASPRAR